MKKFVDGKVFDTEGAQSWVVGHTSGIMGDRAGDVTLWRGKDGQWVQETEKHGSVIAISSLSPADAAEAFTTANIDLPDVLISDLEGPSLADAATTST